MKKVIFLPGFLGTRWDHIGLKSILKSFEFLLFNYDTRLLDSIEDIALKLDVFIKDLDLEEGEKISLVGISTGGVILDYYLKFIDNTKVEKAVTVSSPIKGTLFLNLFPKRMVGVRELAKDSEFIKKLNSKKVQNVKIKSFWCYFDPYVYGTTAKYENPEHTFFFFHPLIHYWPPLNYRIKEFLES